jgi:hypothetical protein
MGMRRKSTAKLILAASMIAGCSTTGPFGREKLALPVGPSYIGGRGMQVFPVSDTLVPNVKDAMTDVGIRSIVQSQDPSGLIILEGTTADDRRARITLLNSGQRSTVSAKVGWLGDEPVTRALLDRIGSRQGTFERGSPIEAEREPASPKFLSRDAVPDTTMLRDQINAGYSSSIPGSNP